MTGQSLIYGTGMGLATLSSQAFGAKNYRRVGVLWQRQCVYQWLLCIVVAAIWWHTEAILLTFGQPPRVAANAATWARWQLPGLPAMPMLNSMNAFLQSQRIVRPSAVVALLSNFLVTVPLCWYLTQPGSLGFAGAPLSIAVGQLINSSIMYVVAPRVIKHPCWGPWTRDAWRGWWELIRLGMGGAIGLWAEWWAAEAMVFLAGLLCTLKEPGEACTEVAVTVLLRNVTTHTLCFCARSPALIHARAFAQDRTCPALTRARRRPTVRAERDRLLLGVLHRRLHAGREPAWRGRTGQGQSSCGTWGEHAGAGVHEPGGGAAADNRHVGGMVRPDGGGGGDAQGAEAAGVLLLVRDRKCVPP